MWGRWNLNSYLWRSNLSLARVGGRCWSLSPPFDDSDNPRPPATIPQCRAARGPTICSCEFVKCNAVGKGTVCRHGGRPVFHVSYFPDWTGCLSGTSLSDDPHDKAYRKKRAREPPREPLTLRESRESLGYRVSVSGIFGGTRTTSESDGTAAVVGDDDEDTGGGDGKVEVEVLGILSVTPSGMYKVRYATPPGNPQPPDGWVQREGVTSEQVKAYHRKLDKRKRQAKERLISKRAREIRGWDEPSDSEDSEDEPA